MDSATAAARRASVESRILEDVLASSMRLTVAQLFCTIATERCERARARYAAASRTSDRLDRAAHRACVAFAHLPTAEVRGVLDRNAGWMFIVTVTAPGRIPRREIVPFAALLQVVIPGLAPGYGLGKRAIRTVARWLAADCEEPLTVALPGGASLQVAALTRSPADSRAEA